MEAKVVIPPTPPLRGGQPSPTGDDDDPNLTLPPAGRVRMINGSAHNGWQPKLGEDPRAGGEG